MAKRVIWIVITVIVLAALLGAGHHHLGPIIKANNAGLETTTNVVNDTVNDTVNNTVNKVSNTELPGEEQNTHRYTDFQIDIYADITGRVFGILEKEVNKVNSYIRVDAKPSALELTKEGRVKAPIKAWRFGSDAISIEVNSYEVVDTTLFTTVKEIVAATVMGDKTGYTHRLFDESKGGQLVAKLHFVYCGSAYTLQVWHQSGEYVLRPFGQGKQPGRPVVTQPPAETLPPVTQPPAETLPPATQQPVVTQPPAIKPPAETLPPATQQPVVTQPPATQQPVVTQPPAGTTSDGVTQPPVANWPSATATPRPTSGQNQQPVVTQPPAVTAAPVRQPNADLDI